MRVKSLSNKALLAQIQDRRMCIYSLEHLVKSGQQPNDAALLERHIAEHRTVLLRFTTEARLRGLCL